MKLSHRISTLNGVDSDDDGWSVWYKARDMMDAGEHVTLLCIGDHDFASPHIAIDATKAALDAGRTRYAPVDGKPDLRALIAERVTARTGVATAPSNVFVSNGGQGALFNGMMATTDPGDKVCIIDPHYATYPSTVRSASCQILVYTADADQGFQIDAQDLMKATKGAKTLLVNSPNNPTGAVYNDASMQAIRQAALENDLWVISDEVYDTQVHNGTHVSPRAMADMKDRSLVVGSLSKSHVMTGFRLGWLVGPDDLISSLTALTNATTYGAPSFIQDAAENVLKHGAESELQASAIYTRRRNLAVKVLQGTNALRVSPPDGAMYVMLDIRPTGLSGYDFAHMLIEKHKIAVMPGESFGTAASGHIRVALTINDDDLKTALGTIKAFAASLVG